MGEPEEMEELLRIALLRNGALAREVYENRLEDNVSRWHVGLQISGEQFLFAVAESEGEIAMVLLEGGKRLYINGAAREKLTELWEETYTNQMEILIPMIAEDLAEGVLSVTAVQYVS
ncbi:MAG TPA: hypothetical protein V6D06_03715 [Trichocoleus sp.]